MTGAAKATVLLAVSTVLAAAAAIGVGAATAAPVEQRLSEFERRADVVDALTARCGVSISDRNAVLDALRVVEKRGWASTVVPLARHQVTKPTRVVVLTHIVSTYDTTTGAQLCATSF